MIKLYQMPVSHFCEKIRWALAYKRLPHKYKNLLPGLHIRPMMKLCGQSSLPVLKDGKHIVYNSSDILTYLDDAYPRFQLTPEDPALKEEALDWEKYVDQNVGPAVRIVAYSELLKRPDLLLPMFAHEGPWYTGFVLKKAFPRIRSALRKFLPVNEESVAKSFSQLTAAKEKLMPVLRDSEFLVGDTFSRADLAVAALWAPLFSPGKYGVPWPDTMPLELQNIEKQFEELKPWVESVYAKYR